MASSSVSSCSTGRSWVPGAPASQARTGFFDALPHALLWRIWALLPVDERARCAVVHPSWRTALHEHSVWARLDLSCTSGIARRRVTGELLRGAAARARGHLEHLNLEDCYLVEFEDIRLVAQANAKALRTLHLPRKYEEWRDFHADAAHEYVNHNGHKPDELVKLLQAAPGLQALTADLIMLSNDWDVDLGRQMLQNVGEFAPLRLGYVVANVDGDDEDAGSILQLMALVPGHATLTGLGIWGVPFEHAPAAFDAVVDVAQQANSHLRELQFYACDFGGSGSMLAPLLSAASSLSSLSIEYDSATQLFDAAAAALAADALRLNTNLSLLTIYNADLFWDPAAGGALFSALVAHCSLRTLVWREETGCTHPGIAGVALHAILAANAPALRNLVVDVCLDDLAGRAPLFDALRRNTHLRRLDCCTWQMTPSFARFVLLPAVRANTSLRQLFLPISTRNFDLQDDLDKLLEQAAALVRRRTRLRGAK